MKKREPKSGPPAHPDKPAGTPAIQRAALMVRLVA